MSARIARRASPRRRTSAFSDRAFKETACRLSAGWIALILGGLYPHLHDGISSRQSKFRLFTFSLSIWRSGSYPEPRTMPSQFPIARDFR